LRNTLDEVARSLAEPMTRGRAIKVLGGALLGAAVPGLARTGPARASVTQRAGLNFCGPGTTPCPTPPNCCDSGWYCADKPTHACCYNGTEYCVLPDGDATCCEKGNHCAHGIGCCGKKAFCGDPCCEHGGSECLCPRGEVCHKGSCEVCPHGKHKCGDKQCCNPHKEKCCANTCCKKDQGCCGELCCDKGQQCCNGNICCFKNEECCGDECCGKHTQCAIDPSSGKQVCCRGIHAAHVGAGIVVCCPSGYIVGPGGNRCCPQDQPGCAACTPACGAGTFCFNGTCVSLPGA
jgi:hypothetical protein